MKKGITKISMMVLTLIVILVFAAGCGSFGDPNSVVGTWHAELKLSDIDSSEVNEEDRMLLGMITGNNLAEIDVEFRDDSTFSYTLNTDDLQDATSGSIGSLFSLFTGFDVSSLLKNLMGYYFEDTMNNFFQDSEGTYTILDNGDVLIDISSEQILLERHGRNELHLVDEDSNITLVFKRQK